MLGAVTSGAHALPVSVPPRLGQLSATGKRDVGEGKELPVVPRLSEPESARTTPVRPQTRYLCDGVRSRERPPARRLKQRERREVDKGWPRTRILSCRSASIRHRQWWRYPDEQRTTNGEHGRATVDG